MSTKTTTRKTRRASYVSVDVGSVDVDLGDLADDLVAAGWHHEDEWEDLQDSTESNTRQALLDWHDAEHGTTDWATCRQGPCAVIPHEFKDHR